MYQSPWRRLAAILCTCLLIGCGGLEAPHDKRGANAQLPPPVGSLCQPGDQAYCNWAGVCDATGSTCECDDETHYSPDDQCASWQQAVVPPGLTCLPGDRSYCHWAGTCDAAGSGCECDQPAHYDAADQCSSWQTAVVPDGSTCLPGDRDYCHYQGACDAAGAGCECDDPAHYDAADRCSTWRPAMAAPGDVCVPGDRQTCSGHGTCAPDGDSCACDTEWWHGALCEVSSDQCPGYGQQPPPVYWSDEVCSGAGACIAADTCACDPGFAGDECETEAALTCPVTEQASTGGLFYPSQYCEETVALATAALASGHYRSACSDTLGTDPADPVLEALVVSCADDPPGFSTGSVVYVDVCCDVLDEEICDDGLDNDGNGLVDDGCGLSCPVTEQAIASGLHYPGSSGHDCESGTAESEAALFSFHYRNACHQQLGTDLAPDVLEADVVSCEVAPPGFSDGVVLSVAVCCDVLDEEICDDGLDNDGNGLVDDGCGLSCPVTEQATASGLHYPGYTGHDCESATAESEAALSSGHYRNACHEQLGTDLAPDVLEADVVSCEVAPPGFSDGVVVSVDVCCDVLDEEICDDGLDNDGNGEVDDGCVVLVPCGGDVLIENQDDVDAIAHCASVDSLTVARTATVAVLELPNLVSVGGVIMIHSVAALTSISMPSLETSGHLDIRSNNGLLETSLPSLTEVTDSVDIGSNYFTTDLDLSSLTTVASHLDVQSFQNLTALSLESVEVVGGHLYLNGLYSLAAISLPRLQATGGEFFVANTDALETLSAPLLTSIGGQLLVRTNHDLTAVDLGSLELVSGDLTTYENDVLSTFLLSSLTAVDGDSAFFENPSLCVPPLPWAIITAGTHTELDNGICP